MLRRSLLQSVALLPLAFASGAVVAQRRYLAGMEDVPLAPALATPDAPFSFDSPQGRIIITYAKGATDRASVLAFYATSLPQLGWRREEETLFRREGESLRLEFGPPARDLTVRFTLAPAL
jgi:hypothetical protein